MISDVSHHTPVHLRLKRSPQKLQNVHRRSVLVIPACSWHRRCLDDVPGAAAAAAAAATVAVADRHTVAETSINLDRHSPFKQFIYSGSLTRAPPLLCSAFRRQRRPETQSILLCGICFADCVPPGSPPPCTGPCGASLLVLSADRARCACI